MDKCPLHIGFNEKFLFTFLYLKSGLKSKIGKILKWKISLLYTFCNTLKQTQLKTTKKQMFSFYIKKAKNCLLFLMTGLTIY
jgi:hypothetical protein